MQAGLNLLDLLALIVAVIALWFALRESRRNSSVVLKVQDCRCSFPESVHENKGQSFTEFRVLIRNEGVSLYGPQLRLSFLEKDGFAIASMPMKRRDGDCRERDQFQRGMIAEFSIKTYELNQDDIRFLQRLEDVAKQRATLCLYSQGYLARAVPVVNWAERVKSLWNKFAVRFNYRSLKKGQGIRVSPLDPSRYQLPTFATPRLPLGTFIDSLRREQNIARTLE